MSRVIFVGVHYKPGMLALDSRTRSGKLIDRVIKELPDSFQSVKSNVFNLDYFPTGRTADLDRQWLENWIDRLQVTSQDIVVTLGHTVNEVFRKNKFPSIKAGHPSAVWSKENQEEYITKLYVAICTTIKEPELVQVKG